MDAVSSTGMSGTPTRARETDGETAGRAVFVTQHYPPEQGGAASRIHDTAANLSEEGWDVDVVTPPACYPFEEYERSWKARETYDDDGITVHRIWTWQPSHRDPGVLARLPYFLLFALHAIVWLFQHRGDHDVLITTTPPIFTGLVGLFGSLFTPWVVDVRDLWIDNAVELGYIERGGLAERSARWLQRTVIERADRLTVTTAGLGAAIANRYGESLTGKTVVVPNGVDTERFAPGDGPEEPVVVYTGTLGRAQDLETAIEAMAHLESVATLRLVGSGDAEGDLKRLAGRLGVDDHVEFVGLVDREEVPGILNRAQVAIAPIKSTDELAYAMPTKVYEYLACGLPTVVTGQGEIVEFAAASGGTLHTESDPEALGSELDRLLSDPSLRREMGIAGRQEAVEEHGRRAIARRLSDQLTSLIVQNE